MANNFSYEDVSGKSKSYGLGDFVADARAAAQAGGATIPMIPSDGRVGVPGMPPGIPVPGFRLSPGFPAQPVPPQPSFDQGQQGGGTSPVYVPSSGPGLLGKLLIAGASVGTVVLGYRIWKKRKQKNVSVAGLFGFSPKRRKKNRR